MLRVVHSNRVALLAQQWVESLPAQLSPFPGQQQVVIVGNRVIGQYLSRQVAMMRGVCVGIECVSYEAALRSMLGKETGVRGLSKRELAVALAAALATDDWALPLSNRDALPLRSYLADHWGDHSKRVGLAERMADLYWQYALARPAMLRRWLQYQRPSAGTAHIDDDIDQTQALWQIALLRSTLALSTSGATQWTLLPLLPSLLQMQNMQIGQIACASLSVFGFSHLLPAQLELCSHLALHNDVTVYASNPCELLWDDVAGRKTLRASTVSDQDPSETLLLSLWGRPVRDTITSLVDASAGDFTDAFAPITEPETLLQRPLLHLLQDTQQRKQPDVATPTIASFAPAITADRDVRVISATSVRRELESIGQHILQLLRDDPNLHATQIAVLLAGGDADRYFKNVPYAFERVGAVPFHIMDGPTGRSGGAVDALLSILDLPGSQWTRADLLRVMAHPLIMSAFPNIAPGEFAHWADQLGIVHGRNSADHQGTYLASSSTFHWDYGIARLALGTMMVANSDQRPAVLVGGRPFAPCQITHEEQADAATFALLARSLIADAEWMAKQSVRWSVWKNILLATVAAYVEPRDHGSEQEVSALRNLLGNLLTVIHDEREISFDEMKLWMARWLTAQRSDRGELLSQGVMVAPLTTMRNLPFRHVFVAGLGEAQFPSGGDRNPLDVRTQLQRNEVTTKERDRLAFFEALLCAADSVTLSYVGLQETTGELLGPSAVILELCDALAPYLGVANSQAALTAITTSVPMFDFSEQAIAMFNGAVPRNLAAAQWGKQVGRELRTHMVAGGQPVLPEGLLGGLLADKQPALADALGMKLQRSSVHTMVSTVQERQFNMSSFVLFLESPVQAWAKIAMNWHDTSDEQVEVLANKVNEPFELDSKAHAIFLRDVMEQHLRWPARSLLDVYLSCYRQAALQGQAPLEVFADAHQDHDLQILQQWRTAIGLQAVPPDGKLARRLAIGKSYQHSDILLPAVRLPVVHRDQPNKRAVLSLFGGTSLIVPRLGSVVFRNGKIRHQDHLRGAFDHILLTITADQQRPHSEHTHTVINDKGEVKHVAHAAWHVDEARAYLHDLAAELLWDTHSYLLPLEQLRNALVGSTSIGRQEQALGFGAVKDTDGLLAGSEITEFARQAAQRRLAPLVNKMTGDHPFVKTSRSKKS
jgi:exodeoxyribonuclease V gamma subunit